MKDIEDSDMISERYLSDVDEVFFPTLDSYPASTSVFIVLELSGGIVFQPSYHNISSSPLTLRAHGAIFRFTCDDEIHSILAALLSFAATAAKTQLLDFFSNPQRSHHHAVDPQTHNSVTECCFSYILDRRLTHFPGIHHWASKSKHRPWLWRWRKPKGATSNVQKLRWPQMKHIGYNKKKLEPFCTLFLAFKYLPYLLDKATRSEELISLAKMWSYRCLPLVSLCPHITKKAERAVEDYLSRFDGMELCESEVAVGTPLLSNALKLKFFADGSDLLFCLTPPPSEPSFQRMQIARELPT